MEYNLYFGKDEFKLKKFTLAMQETVDKITKSNNLSARASAELLMKFVKDAGIPEGDLKTLIGGESIDECDIRELEVLATEIMREYNDRRNKAQNNQLSAEIRDFIKDNQKAVDLVNNLAQVKNVAKEK